MNLAQLRKAFYDEMRERDETHFPTSVVDRWLNAGANELAMATGYVQKKHAITTANGTRAYALPEDCFEVVAVAWGDANGGQVLTLTPVEWADIDWESGVPETYTVWDKNLTLFPTPDQAYTLKMRYNGLPSDMVADSDTPEGLGTPYHNALVMYACSKASAYQDDPNKQTYFIKEFGEYVKKLRTILASQGGIQIVGR